MLNNYSSYPFDRMAEAVPIKTKDRIYVTLANGEEMWYKFNTDIADAHPHGNPGEYMLSADYRALHEISVFDSEGELIHSVDTSLSIPSAVTLEHNKPYFIRVRFDKSYEATVWFELDYVNQYELLENGFAKAEEVTLSNPDITLTGEFNGLYSRRWYKVIACGMFTHINGDPGEYYFTVDSDIKTSTVIYTPDGVELGRKLNLGYDNKLTVTLDSGGEYYLCVTASCEKTVEFSLTTDHERLPYQGSEVSVATKLSLGQSYLDAIGIEGEERWFEFTPSNPAYHPDGAPAKYIFYSEGESDIKVYLYDSDLYQLSYNENGGWNSNFRLYYNLDYGQTYYILIKSRNGTAGDFYINVNALSAMQAGASSEAAIEVSQLKKGITETFDNSNHQVWHKFTANAPEAHGDGETGKYYISSYCNNLLSESLYNSKMELVAQSLEIQGGNSSTLEVELDYGETYYIRSDTTMMPVEYILSINYRQKELYSGNSIETAIPISLNHTVSGYSDYAFHNRWYKFKADSGNHPYTIKAEGDVHLNGELYSASGEMLESDPDADNGIFDLTKTLKPETWYYVRLTSPVDVYGDFTIMVEGVKAESVFLSYNSYTLDVGQALLLTATVKPNNASNKNIIWSSSDKSVATVQASGSITGIVSTKKPGTVTITATTEDGGYEASCEIWIKGKTPVFLIHGRTDHSCNVWGIENGIGNWKNTHFASEINSLSQDFKPYIRPENQKILHIKPSTGGEENPCNLGYELKNAGYVQNVNLFAFNYPSVDAVIHNARKFSRYIENLITDIRENGSDEKKSCFYASKSDYDANNYRLNIIGHSMGGLVARYYIENLGQDKHVNKLITICTPHWGSGLANLGTMVPGNLVHYICDHDLVFNSAMYGGDNSVGLNCEALFGLTPCYNDDYLLTNRLLYDRKRNTKYYALAGLDYDASKIISNDVLIEIPSQFNSYQQIVNSLTLNNIYKTNPLTNSIVEIDPKSVGDGTVGLLSQIGWTGDASYSSQLLRIPMEKIYISIDSNGGNSLADSLHMKMSHRKSVCKFTINCLEE